MGPLGTEVLSRRTMPITRFAVTDEAVDPPVTRHPILPVRWSVAM